MQQRKKMKCWEPFNIQILQDRCTEVYEPSLLYSLANATWRHVVTLTDTHPDSVIRQTTTQATVEGVSPSLRQFNIYGHDIAPTYKHTLISTFIADCICCHINTTFAQDIVTSHRIYCITQRRSSNCNLVILWNYNFNSVNFKSLCILAKYKFFKLPEDDTDVSKHVEVSIIQRENIVKHIFSLISCNKNKSS